MSLLRVSVPIIISALAALAAPAQTQSSTSQQLEQVKSQIAGLEKTLAALNDQVKALEARDSQEQLLQNLNRRIADAESTMSKMRALYSPQYPEVRNAESYLKFLYSQRDALQKKN
jgi:phage shock protein A